ncbi:GlsB/YeaQ/YmgE family stress response membrane protein [Candidatus Kaiserbacteria bacterium CG_4_9_14_0_2_um_filter_41_32]|uniref:GlsB/YeaQ/YmgE family stress response membrane protein n=1 Tax=Candidatus Kaiserbacteria bacterium CG_4_9_14_0_2_um_filter_41_32 TaxID=1974601 RepID=A0A2M8FFC5_9BACT|nr:MAG: GlsB/YeaQ/YmgE family stress response membrane protein [Candidatus Kaiserbacteria bacterium CG_4_9_14_0_2_um_filter_41_32]
MNFLVWIIFGGLAGWIGSMIMGTDGQQGIILNIVVGIIGAGLGGYIMNLFGNGGVNGFNLYSFIVAVIGAVVLLAVLRLIRGS